MAYRINTIEYGWNSNSVAQSGSVRYDSPTRRIFIPETQSRTFLNADVQLYLTDANTGTTISSVSNYALSCSIDGNLNGQPFTSRTMALSGDHVNLIYIDNFANAFNQRFTGSNHDVAFSFQFPQTNSGRWIGHAFKLLLTYQFDDTSTTTGIKTVRIPSDSISSSLLAATFLQCGNQTANYPSIPALDTFLPEANKTYRDIFFEYNYWMQDTGATNTGSVAVRFNSGSTFSRFVLQNSLTTSRPIYDIHNVSGTLDTTVPNTISVSASVPTPVSGQTPFTLFTPLLYVTYEYNYTGSQSVMNSLILPLDMNTGFTWGMPNYVYKTILLPEPSPSLQQSAFRVVQYMQEQTQSLGIVSQPLTSHILPAGTQLHGMLYTRQIRFDGLAPKPASLSLQRGINTIGFVRTSNLGTADVINESVVTMYLNYSSSKSNLGIGSHNKTIYFASGSLFGTNSTFKYSTLGYPTSSIHADIKTSYFINGIIRTMCLNFPSTRSPTIGYMVDITGSNGVSSSRSIRRQLGGGLNPSRQPEVGASIIPTDLDDFYMRFPNQFVQNRQDYFVTHSEYVLHDSSQTSVVADTITMNWNKVGVTGSLLNCNFPATQYQVYVYLSGSDEFTTPLYKLIPSESSANKTFKFDWYEDVSNLYAVTTYPEYGISNFATASNSNIFTINFAAPVTASTTEHSYTFIG